MNETIPEQIKFTLFAIRDYHCTLIYHVLYSFFLLTGTITRIILPVRNPLIFYTMTGNEEHVIIGTSKGFTVIRLNDITFFKGNGSYTELYLNSRKEIILLSSVLKNVEDKLMTLDAHFYRIHKSYLINIRYVKEYCCRRKILIMHDDKEIPIACRNIRNFYDWCKKSYPYLS